MLEKTFGLLFFLKQPKNQKKEERYLYLRITVNGIAKEVSLKRIWSANKWNQATGRATGNKEDARSLNEYLDTLASRTHQTKSLPKADQHNFLFTNFVKDIATYMMNKYGMNSNDAFSLAWAGMGDTFNDASDDTSFATADGKSLTKSEISGNMAAYAYVGKESKGSPNCPK